MNSTARSDKDDDSMPRLTRLIPTLTSVVVPTLLVLAVGTVMVPSPPPGLEPPAGLSAPQLGSTEALTRGTAISTAARDDDDTAAERILGRQRSGLPWASGAWVGGRFSTQSLVEFGQWRGRPLDVVTAYSSRSSFATMANDSWSISTWGDFPGRLNYGLALLPDSGEGSLATIAAGQQDAVWRQVARNLVAHRRGNSIVRVGWESNLPDWRWQATAANAADYRAAYRRVVQIMRAEAPDLVFEFGVACGADLDGSSKRLAALTDVYPGDDVVDLVGCDVYDWWQTHADSDRSWTRVLKSAHGPGVQDVADFARKHDKGASFAEWGLARNSGGNGAGGDNPYFVTAMHKFFAANADVVVFECYFDEPDPYIANSLWGTGQNPRASRAYAELW